MAVLLLHFAHVLLPTRVALPRNKGVVTGDGFDTIGSGSSCWPYQLEICAHHVAPSNGVPACPEQEYSTPACRTTCSESKYGTTFNDDKHFAKSAYSINSVQQMMEEIYTKGSLSVAFTVYQGAFRFVLCTPPTPPTPFLLFTLALPCRCCADFLSYKSGVYTHQSGQALGGHAVKFVGWGVEAGTPYWWVMNSWNKCTFFVCRFRRFWCRVSDAALAAFLLDCDRRLGRQRRLQDQAWR